MCYCCCPCACLRLNVIDSFSASAGQFRLLKFPRFWKDHLPGLDNSTTVTHVQANLSILQGQGRLTAAQRTEFYKQYYQEMIRRGAEGLRNMNVLVDPQAAATAVQAPAPSAANAVRSAAKDLHIHDLYNSPCISAVLFRNN